MNEAVDYAIWLRKNTIAFEDGYYHFGGRNYSIDSASDMRELHMQYYFSQHPRRERITVKTVEKKKTVPLKSKRGVLEIAKGAVVQFIKL